MPLLLLEQHSPELLPRTSHTNSLMLSQAVLSRKGHGQVPHKSTFQSGVFQLTTKTNKKIQIS